MFVFEGEDDYRPPAPPWALVTIFDRDRQSVEYLA
jgi:hypothetical protein